MSVYACPELLQNLSPELKKRMQGKSCFNFKEVDEQLFKELATLTKAGAAKFSDERFIEDLRKAQVISDRDLVVGCDFDHLARFDRFKGLQGAWNQRLQIAHTCFFSPFSSPLNPASSTVCTLCPTNSRLIRRGAHSSSSNFIFCQ